MKFCKFSFSSTLPLSHNSKSSKEIKLIIYHEKDRVIYHVEDVVELQKENQILMQKTSLLKTSISFEKALRKSNLNIHEFPFFDRDATEKKHFIFDITIEKGGVDFHFYFKYYFTVESEMSTKPLRRFGLMNTSISEINETTYHYLKMEIDSFRFHSRKTKPEQSLANKINVMVQSYFNKHNSKDLIEATALHLDFVKHEIFRENEGKTAINKFLRNSNKTGDLDKVPFAYSERKGLKTYGT